MHNVGLVSSLKPSGALIQEGLTTFFVVSLLRNSKINAHISIKIDHQI